MNQPISRSEFFERLARGGLMAGLLGVGAASVHGQRDVSECFNHNYCDSCWAFDGCGLPEKKEARNEQPEKIRQA